MTIGENIKTLRLKKGLTQKELARLAGIPVVTLQQYERGVRKQPKLESLEKIADALETTVVFLQGYTNDPTLPKIDLHKILQKAEQRKAQYEEGLKTWGSTYYRFDPTKIPDPDLSEAVQIEGFELVILVHKICGMYDKSIEAANEDGTLHQVFNPKKIELVKDFIEDNEKTLRKMIDLMDK